MAVDAQMQRPQRPQTQGCVIVLAQSFKQRCLKSAALSCHTMWQPKRLTRHGRLQATTYTIFIQRVDKLQQYIAKSV